MLRNAASNLWLIHALMGMVAFHMAEGDGGGDGDNDGGAGAAGGSDGDGAGGARGGEPAGLFSQQPGDGGGAGDGGDSDAGGDPAGAGQRPDWVKRDHYWDPEKGQVNAEAIHKDLVAAQQQLAKGQPKAPENYEVKLTDDQLKLIGGGKEDFKASDDPVIGGFTGIAKEIGLSQENYDKLLNWYMGTAKELMGEAPTYEGEMAKLGESGKQIMATINRKLEHFQKIGIFNEQDVLEFKLTGQTAEGASMLMKMMAHYGEQPIPHHQLVHDSKISADELTAMRWEVYESGPNKGKIKYYVSEDHQKKVDALYDQLYGDKPAMSSVVLGAR